MPEDMGEPERNEFLSAVNIHLPPNLYSDIMLITATCGWGKTTYCLSGGLAEQINSGLPQSEAVKPNEILFLTSRKAIIEQQIKAHPDVQRWNNRCPWQEQITITSYHQFGAERKAHPNIQYPYKLIILDEIHSLFSETIFAEPLIYVIEYLKEHWNSVLKVGLTATPEFLTDFISHIQPFQFRQIDTPLEAKYKAEHISIYLNTKVKTVLNDISPTINAKHKSICYTMSAHTCYNLAQIYKRSAFLISDYNTGTTEDGTYLADIMNEAGVKQYIMEHSCLPEHIDIIFLNSACREGMNLADSNIKTVICEACDMMTIEQIFGRVRGNIEHFYVVYNGNRKTQISKQINEYLELRKKANASDNPMLALAERAGEQKQNGELSHFVYEYRGQYQLNEFAFQYLLYMESAYIQMGNYQMDEWISSRTFTDISQTVEYQRQRDYLNHLAKYQYKGLPQIIPAQRAYRNTNALKLKYSDRLNEYLDRYLNTSERSELATVLDMRNVRGEPAKWTTAKKELLEAGYTIDGKKSNGAMLYKISMG